MARGDICCQAAAKRSAGGSSMQKAVTVPPPELVHDCEAAVRYLGRLPTAAPSASGPAQDPVAFAVCSAPAARTPPQFLVHLRHPFPMCEFVIGLGDDIDIPKLRFSCIPVTNLRLYLDLSVSFEQRWNLLRRERDSFPL